MLESLTHEIHDAGLEPARWPGVLSRISDRFGGATVFLCQCRQEMPYAGDAWSFGYDLNAFRGAPARLWEEEANPVVTLMRQAPVGIPMDRRRFIDDVGLDRHPVARHFLLGQGLFHVALAVAQRDSDTASQIFVARGRSSEPFSRDDLAEFGRLAADVGRAMRMHRALGQVAAGANGFAAVLDRLAQAVVLTDGALRILHANVAAERLLEAADGLYRFHGALRLHCATAQCRLEAAARGAADQPPSHDPETTAIRGPRPSQAALRLTVFPALGEATSAQAPRASAIVLIHDPEAALASLTPERLAGDHDLTETEARVAALAGQALPVAAIAQRLEVSPNTAKTHHKAVYGKLGVRSQAELVRLLMSRHPPAGY
jgi:DNA-binding CsgD family transcriptional regulator/PAS domain-containing protein